MTASARRQWRIASVRGTSDATFRWIDRRQRSGGHVSDDANGNGRAGERAAQEAAVATASGGEEARELFRRLTERPVDLLRFATAGSVDDGKSTLIGRLLYDSKQVLTDQLEHVEQTSQRMGHDFLDLSLLTDGLRAEREQGITIDVAYRYFA